MKSLASWVCCAACWLALSACQERAALQLPEPPALVVADMEPQVARLLEARRAAVSAAPQSAAAWAAYGAALDAHQLLTEAEVALGAAAALDPAGFAHVLEYALVGALLGRDSDEVLRRYERALALRPEDPTARARYGDALLDAGRPADALLAFERALALAPDDPRTALQRGRTLVALERGQDAVAALEPLARSHPRSREVQGALAEALRAAGETARAAELSAKLTELEERPLAHRDPWRAPIMELTATAAARHQRATRAAARGDFAAAERELEVLAAERPDEPRFVCELAALDMRQRRPAAAAARLERHLDANPERAGAHAPLLALLGQLHVELGRPAEGLGCLERARELVAAWAAAEGLDPRSAGLDVASLHARASALGQLGRWPEAADSFQAAAALAPAPAEYHFLAGLALCEAGLLDDARAALGRGRALDAAHPLAATLAARCAR